MPVAPRTKTPYWSPKPKPDVIATDGQKITVGDATITLYLTPGHTPGTVSVVLPIKDRGVTRMAALWGGTGVDAGNPNALKLYLGSLKHFAAATKVANVEIELLAHPGLDDTIKREEAVRALKPGQQNPFLIGSENYQTYLTMMQDCMLARLANLEGQGAP
jgi:metallo-beta-lactamase class B